MLRPFRLVSLSAFLLAAALPPAATASTERLLNSRWQGAWVITDIETASDCGGRYTDNEVRGKRVISNGDRRFSNGELATVHKIDLKRKRLDILLDLAEPLRLPRFEGPFTLYDVVQCKVELQIDLPRRASSGPAEDLDELISDLLDPHDDLAAAQGSPAWNRRQLEPMPEDYDVTLAEYEIWRVQQVNADIAVRIEDSVEEAARLVDRLDTDEEVLAGFAAGIDRARSEGLDRNCERLLDMSAASFVGKPSGERSRDFRDGYRDGQRLVFFLEVARRLPSCLLPPPAPGFY